MESVAKTSYAEVAVPLHVFQTFTWQAQLQQLALHIYWLSRLVSIAFATFSWSSFVGSSCSAPVGQRRIRCPRTSSRTALLDDGPAAAAGAPAPVVLLRGGDAVEAVEALLDPHGAAGKSPPMLSST